VNIYIDIFLWVVFAILVFNVAYMTLYAIAGLFYGKENFPIIEKKLRFAIFIPAYKGDEVIIHTATETIKQAYPKEAFDVIVIADSLREESIAMLKSLPLIVVEVKFANSTKGKSINAAIQEVANNHYDYAVILDIDNIVEEKFLEKMNSALQNNQLVLQAHRLAKNEDTGFSILDGISEEINNHIFRKGHKVLGISAALIGSGKAIKYPFFVEIMKNINAVGGFDKQMEILIISKRIIIDYAHEILVYDEKVQKSEVFQNQRKRWMSAQFTYMKKYALKGIWTSITTLNMDYLDKSIQLVLLPRLINLGMSIIFCLVWFTPSILGNWFVIILVVQIFALLLATPIKYYNKNTLKALLNLPYGFLLMFLNFFKLRGANKKFIHTPHSVSENTNSKGSS